MAWPSAERRVSFQRVQQLPRNVANNYPEMWSKPHFFVFWEQADEKQKPVDSVTLPSPNPPSHGSCHYTLVLFYNEALVSDIFMETAVVGLGLLG